MKKVLVLPGGGAAGTIQLAFLTKLEQQSGKKISDIFDLIVGTSVGAINGSVLASGMSANEFYPLFRRGLNTIFKKSWYSLGIFGPLYKRENFEKVWKDIFGAKSGILMEELKVPFMCTSVDRVNDENYYFRSWNEKYKKEPVMKIVERSFAAPYYFGQLVDKENKSVWFDGGTGIANCPMDQAFTQCYKFGWLPNETVQFTVVTCGSAPLEERNKAFNRIKEQGIKGQVADYMDPLNGGLARKQSTEDQVNRYTILEGFVPIEFRYIDATITKGSMDDISKETQDYLEEQSEYMMYIVKSKGWKW
jgi:uncharacterized protein